MKQVTINITVNAGGTVNVINHTATPYRSVTDNQGMLHTFYSKEDYIQFTEELQEKNK